MLFRSLRTLPVRVRTAGMSFIWAALLAGMVALWIGVGGGLPWIYAGAVMVATQAAALAILPKARVRSAGLDAAVAMWRFTGAAAAAVALAVPPQALA